jgi:hypothetical protein
MTKVTLVPHTHWDREWYAPFEEFSRRLVAMMDTLLELGEHGFPHFHLDGQTAMIDDYLAIRPEREDDVRRLAAEGRVSLGPWVTQMDEFLASGESHIRNLERGLARARELGPALEVGYMPDQFGHIGQMPQILTQGGIARAVVWRGVPASVDRTAFWWEAPDGSRVLTEYMVFGYFNGGAFEALDDPSRFADAIRGCLERLHPFRVDDRALVMVGYDHAGPDPTLPDRVVSSRRALDGIDVAIGGLIDHVGTEPPTSNVPVWRGELRSSARAHLLPNVVSARVHQKRERGRVESLIERYAEPLAALVPGFDWPAEELDRAWTLLLWNGAHDSACGCSHDQVALDVDARFREARAIGDGIVSRALASLGSRVGREGVVVFNPLPFEREGVPGLGWRVDGRRPVVEEASVTVKDGHDGGFLIDGLEILLLDEPDIGDLYNYCWASEGQTPWAPAENRVDGQTVTSWFDDGLEVRTTVTHREAEPFHRLDGVIVNGRADHRLRLHVALPRETGSAIAGSPFELVERPLVSEGGDLEAPSPTWPARHVVLAAGTSLLHEGVFEYEVVEGRALAITLLRCVGTISRKTLGTRPFEAGPDVKTPLAQMIGETAFSLGLWSGADADLLPTVWERFALPIVAAPAAGGGSLPPVGALLDVSGDAQLSNVRRRDGRVEVRLWNHRSHRPAAATVGGRRITLAPARIETIPADVAPR